MDTLELIRVIRESYPFPIAHAHKKTLAVLDNSVEKLTGIFETAETTIQFLALLALAQVRQDLGRGKAVPNLAKLREKLNLATPSLGKWSTMARETMKAYWNAREQLAVPELFDLFWSWDAARQKIGSKPVNNKAIAPLIELRNDFHHKRIQSHQIPELLPTALDWLHQFLAAIRFVAEYQLVFTHRILLDQEREDAYLNELMLFTGCFSAFDSNRWKSAIRLKPESVIFLHPQTGRHLILSPFITFTNQFNGMPDLLVINSLAAKEADYVATLFGHVAKTSQPDWAEGAKQFAALNEFVKSLQQAAESAAPDNLPPEEAAPALKEDDAPMIRKAAAPPAAPPAPHASPYKFLDYYNPEDADIFCGRDREIRLIEQKFHNTRLLVLHGESGTGKTSLIRAGLMPRLSPEVFVPVYVRVLQNPLGEIRRELLRQLGMAEAAQPDMPLMDVLSIVTERVSKTVIIVFDQFEEFFLRFDEEVRRRAIAELAACLTAARLDVKFLMAIRSDYFALLAEFEDALPQIFTHQIHLERLTEAQAVEAVIKPAERLGIQVDEPMVQIKLLPELGANDGGIEPPLLQIVCDALYQHAQRDGRSVVDLRDYEAVGDVTGALGNYLNEKLRQFGKNQAAARAVLKALVTAEGMKRASFVSELCSRINSAGVSMTEHDLQEAYLKKFVSYRLVRVDEVEGAARYELSHDYLAKQIEVWIEASERELTKALELIDRAYETYQATRVLLERSALQALKPFEPQFALPPEKQAFLDRSKTETRKQRRGLWLKVAAALMAVALVVGGGFGYQAYQQYQEALRQKELAINEKNNAETQRQKAEQAKQESDRRAMLSLAQTLNFQALDKLSRYNGPLSALLARQAYLFHQQYQGTTLSQMDNALRRVLDMFPFQSRVLNHLNGVNSVAFSPDGKFLASTGDAGETLLVWDVSTALNTRLMQPDATPRVLAGHEGLVWSVAFSPDGKFLASGGMDMTVRIWDMSQPDASPRVLTGYKNWIWSVAFSPDGKFLASGDDDNTVLVWNLAQPDAAPLGLVGHEGAVSSVAFSPDGTHLASGSWDKTVRVWDLTQPDAAPRILAGYEGAVSSVVFSPDGTRLASGSWDKTVRVWDLTQPVAAPHVLTGHNDEVHCVAFSPDGKILASGDNDQTIRLWDISMGIDTELTQSAVTSRVLAGHENTVTSMAFSPDGKFLASGGDDHTVRLWDMTHPTGVPLVLTGHNDGVRSIAFSPNHNLVASGGEDNIVHVWDITQLASTPRVFTGHEGIVYSVAFSPDGKFLASGSHDGTARVWDITQPTAAPRVLEHGRLFLVSSVAFSPDGHFLASGSSDKTIRVWNLKSLSTAPRVLTGHEDLVYSVAFSPDGKFLASGDQDNSIRVWNLSQPDEAPRILTGHEGWVGSVVFSPDGKFLASGSWDKTVRVWDLTQQIAKSFVLAGHEGSVPSLAFSPDGKFLASGSSDKTIRVWDLASPSAAPLVLTGYENTVLSVAFSPDGKFLTSGSSDGTVHVWIVRTEELAARICDEAGRNLTWDEWHQFIGTDVSYERTCSNLPVHSSVIEVAQNLAKTNKIDEANAIFQLVLRLDTSIKLDPIAEMNRWRAQGILEEGAQFASAGNLKDALAAYAKARELDPTLNIPAQSWNTLCWFGSLNGMAAEMLDACEQAVNSTQDEWEKANYRDSRGLARALTGNTAGAIEDFQTFMKWTTDVDALIQRQEWITALKKGENPFTSEVLEKLRQ